MSHVSGSRCSFHAGRIGVGALVALLLVFAGQTQLSQQATAAEGDSVPSNYELVFSEDFSEPASLQRFVYSSPEHWQRHEGDEHYSLEHSNAGSDGYKPQYRSPYNIALIDGIKVGSFILDYDVQQIGREYGHRDACVFFNFEDPNHYYYTHIASNSDPHAHQIFTVDSAARLAITDKGTDGFDWGPQGKWHRVRVKRDLPSGQIEIYVNDMSKPIMQAVDKTHAAGFVGFGSFDDQGRVTNIRLYAKDVHNAEADFFPNKE